MFFEKALFKNSGCTLAQPCHDRQSRRFKRTESPIEMQGERHVPHPPLSTREIIGRNYDARREREKGGKNKKKEVIAQKNDKTTEPTSPDPTQEKIQGLSQEITKLESSVTKDSLNLRDQIREIRGHFVNIVSQIENNGTDKADLETKLLEFDERLDVLEKRAEIYEAMYAQGEGNAAFEAYVDGREDEMDEERLKELSKEKLRHDTERTQNLRKLADELNRLENGDESEEALETTGQDEDDLTKTYTERRQILREKIRHRLTAEKGRMASDDDVDRLVETRTFSGPLAQQSPLSRFERWKHRALSLLGKAFYRFENRSIYDLVDKFTGLEEKRNDLKDELERLREETENEQIRQKQAFELYHDESRRSEHDAKQVAIKKRVEKLEQSDTPSVQTVMRRGAKIAREEEAAEKTRQQAAKVYNAIHDEETRDIIRQETEKEERRERIQARLKQRGAEQDAIRDRDLKTLEPAIEERVAKMQERLLRTRGARLNAPQLDKLRRSLAEQTLEELEAFKNTPADDHDVGITEPLPAKHTLVDVLPEEKPYSLPEVKASKKRPHVLEDVKIKAEEPVELGPNPVPEQEKAALEEEIRQEAVIVIRDIQKTIYELPPNTSTYNKLKKIVQALDGVLTPWQAAPAQAALEQFEKEKEGYERKSTNKKISEAQRQNFADRAFMLGAIIELATLNKEDRPIYLEKHRSTKKEDSHDKPELLSLRRESTTKGILEKRERREIETVLVADLLDMFKNIPEKALGNISDAEMILHVYQSMNESPSIKHLSELRDGLDEKDPAERAKIEDANELFRSAMHIASQTLKDRIPRLQRLAGRDTEAQEKISLMKKLPARAEELLLQSSEERTAFVAREIQEAYDKLSDRIEEIEPLTQRKPTDLGEELEIKRLSNESVDAQITMQNIQDLAQDAGIPLKAKEPGTPMALAA